MSFIDNPDLSLDAVDDPGARLALIQDKIDIACAEAGKKSTVVTITAVSKKHDAARIEQALKAGHRVFGENRVQEAMSKWPALKTQFPDVALRLIGPLQTNKVKEAIALFDVIETLDRPKLARVIAQETEKQGHMPDLFIEVNVGDEVQKAGISLVETDSFISLCRKEYGLTIKGLMCIPPREQPPAPYFALLTKIAARNGITGLSMGMSGDYEIAVQLGATHVRIGTEIFGKRPE